MQEFIRDKQGRVIGSMISESNGNIRIHRANGTIAGTYIKSTNQVLNSSMRVIGKGIEFLPLALLMS